MLFQRAEIYFAKFIFVLLVVFLEFSSDAPAVSIKNRDDTDHKVTILEDGLQTDHVLKKGEFLEGICQNGCNIRIDGDDVNPYVLEGAEVTSIVGGDLYGEKLNRPSSSDNAKPAQRPSGRNP